MTTPEAINIVVAPLTVEVQSGIGDSLWYQAPGLDVYVTGSVPAKRLPAVMYHAVAECVARGIRAIELKSVRAARSAKLKRDKNQLEMFK